MRLTSRNIKNRLKRIKITNFSISDFSYIFFAIIFLQGCASIQQPTGGPKDTTPPKILSEEPKNLTTNFHQKQIAITFDEYIKLQNEFTEISFSPDMEIRPTFKIKKKTLLINLPDSLEQNTTYTINFGKALVDFNEGNELKNYAYVFSTGPEIDSLSISGNVKNSFTMEPELDATVLLIPTSKDSIFRKSKANIFTRTDSSGNFHLRNLRENTYRIYALKETNNDRIFNNPDEWIGFLKDSIYLDKDTSGIQLNIFREIPKEFRVLHKSIDKAGKLTFGFNRPIKEPSLIILDHEEQNKNKRVEFASLLDSASMWIPDMAFDSLSVQVNENAVPIDTVILKRNKTDEYDRSLLLKDNLSSKMVNRIQHFQLTSSAPIQLVDKAKIILQEDSTVRTNYNIVLDTLYRRKITISYPWRAGKSYTLTLEESALTGFFGDSSQEYKRDFTYDDSENFGDFTLNIKTPDSAQYIIQLVKVDDAPRTFDSKTIKGSQYIRYKNLPGTKFGVRVIYDANENNQWDTGDIDEKRYPEHIWYFDKVITIRPNWEQEEILTIPAEKTLGKSINTDTKESPTPLEPDTEEILPNIKEGIIEPPFIQTN